MRKKERAAHIEMLREFAGDEVADEAIEEDFDGAADRIADLEAQLAERGAQCAAMREALEKLETIARRAPQSARLASARALARAALAPGAGRAYRAELIERCAKVAEAYEPECESCPRGVAAAIRALDKEGT